MTNYEYIDKIIPIMKGFHVISFGAHSLEISKQIEKVINMCLSYNISNNDMAKLLATHYQEEDVRKIFIKYLNNKGKLIC